MRQRDERTQDESTMLLGAAAAVLRGQPVDTPSRQEQARSLLEALDYLALAGTARADAARLLAVGGALKSVFQFAAPEAPGLFFFGGEADPALPYPDATSIPTASLAGSGLQFAKALESCLGEGAEYLSQVERSRDVVSSGSATGIRHGLKEEEAEALLCRLGSAEAAASGQEASIDWIAARRFEDDAPVLVPADLALRRARQREASGPLVPPGLGCAAGRSREQALLGAVLELLERDAAACWWNNGRRRRPVSDEVLERADFAALQSAVRGKSTSRHTWLLDITTEVGVPVVAAISLETDGKGFAFGLACHPDLAVALRKAFEELCQTELAYHIVDLKREAHGDAALNSIDKLHLRRRGWDGALQSSRLRPLGTARALHPEISNSPADQIADVQTAMRALQIPVFFAELTRPDLGVPVVWACSPLLRPLPSRVQAQTVISLPISREICSTVAPFELL